MPRLGAKAFEQAAGFLRVRGGAHPLDATRRAPGALRARRAHGRATSASPSASWSANEARVERDRRSTRYVADDVGLPTLQRHPRRAAEAGPRSARRRSSRRRSATTSRSRRTCSEGMVLEGVVTNIVAFGAFVDVGVHQDGLVHVSQLADRFVRDPERGREGRAEGEGHRAVGRPRAQPHRADDEVAAGRPAGAAAPAAARAAARGGAAARRMSARAPRPAARAQAARRRSCRSPAPSRRTGCGSSSGCSGLRPARRATSRASRPVEHPRRAPQSSHGRGLTVRARADTRVCPSADRPTADRRVRMPSPPNARRPVAPADRASSSRAQPARRPRRSVPSPERAMSFKLVRAAGLLRRPAGARRPHATRSRVAQTTGTVRGRVIEAGGAAPRRRRAGRVVGTTLGAITNAAGEYVIANVPAGARSCASAASASRPHDAPVTVTAGARGARRLRARAVGRAARPGRRHRHRRRGRAPHGRQLDHAARRRRADATQTRSSTSPRCCSGRRPA